MSNSARVRRDVAGTPRRYVFGAVRESTSMGPIRRGESNDREGGSEWAALGLPRRSARR